MTAAPALRGHRLRCTRAVCRLRRCAGKGPGRDRRSRTFAEHRPLTRGLAAPGASTLRPPSRPQRSTCAGRGLCPASAARALGRAGSQDAAPDRADQTRRFGTHHARGDKSAATGAGRCTTAGFIRHHAAKHRATSCRSKFAAVALPLQGSGALDRVPILGAFLAAVLAAILAHLQKGCGSCRRRSRTGRPRLARDERAVFCACARRIGLVHAGADFSGVRPAAARHSAGRNDGTLRKRRGH